VKAHPSRAERWAIVTGASRGIGAATARRLARDGYAVVLVARDVSRLERVRQEIGAAGGVAEVRACDLQDKGAIQSLTADILGNHPTIHALVNNAGVTHIQPATEYDLDEWDLIFSLNVRAAFSLVQALTVPLTKAGGASIVNMSSVLGLLPATGEIAYVASKGALNQLTKGLALELASRKIRVNAVAPGFIETDIFERSHSKHERDAIATAHPLGRLGTVDDVAAVVSFLCSEDAAFLTGAIVPVDGGLTASIGANARSTKKPSSPEHDR
jgi:NAD(P)-dependent dehydrogenase (short-subunit alcohol dehydrogenase family)